MVSPNYLTKVMSIVHLSFVKVICKTTLASFLCYYRYILTDLNVMPRHLMFDFSCQSMAFLGTSLGNKVETSHFYQVFRMGTF